MSTSPLSEDEVREVAGLVSHERLAAFIAIAGTERDALELHHHMMLLAGSLAPVLGMIEIALRNAICERLRQMFGVQDWLLHPPAPFTWRGEEQQSIARAVTQARRAAYTKKSAAEKKALDAAAFPDGAPANISHEKRSKRRQETIDVTIGQVIAQLTLYFWKRLFSPDYETHLWRRSLKRLFPDKTLSRGEVAAQMEVLYQARNRIAHHEPIYGARLTNTLEAIAFISKRFGADRPDPTGILAKMVEPHMPTLAANSEALETLIAKFTVAGI